MQWSCPHCGINLAVSDSTLTTGWSFSRCYKCGGFALVRKTEINIIKVDKAPPGERVILPEASKDPSNGLITEAANQKFIKNFASKIKPETTAPLDQLQKQIIQTQQSSPVQPVAKQVTPPPPPPSALSAAQQFFGKLPDPLPEIHISGTRSKAIPAGIVAATLLAIGSGVYLYIEGQALWHQARDTASRPRQIIHAKDQNANHGNSTATIASNALENKPTQKEVLTPSPLLDEGSESEDQAQLQTSEKNLIAKQSLAVITDQLQRSAMAPMKVEPQANHTLRVKVRGPTANLHSGPGPNYPVVGSAKADIQYSVSDWNDRWFRLSSEKDNVTTQLGWIRNDLVQVLSN